jgi:agmatine/peptidylarginine deiminase
VLDGGNVVAWNDRAIVAEKIFRENPRLTGEAVVETLKTELELSGLIVVPREPCDPIGHSDGMACWLDERTVLINDYATVGERFRRRFRACFDRRGVDVIELPYEPQPGGRRGIPTAAGNWMNFLRIRGVVIVPTFGLSGDRPALDAVKDVHPGHAVEAVDCRALALEGGLLHCVTWQARLPG